MSLVANAVGRSVFSLKISFSGSVNQLTVIEQVDTTRETVFSENRLGDLLIAGGFQGGGIIVNNEIRTLSDSSGLFVLQVDTANQCEIIGEITGSQTVELLDLSCHPDSSQYALAIKTAGLNAVLANGTQVIPEVEEEIIFLSFDASGQIKWHTSMNASTINTDEFAITLGDSSALFAGITFSDSLSIPGETLMGRGQQDIALIKLSAATGDIEWRRDYGTSEDEKVSQLFFEEEMLFFGGEFSGSTPTRLIGNNQFAVPPGAEGSSYISYVIDTIPDPAGQNQASTLRHFSPSSEASKTYKKQNDLQVLNIYPNPFKNSFQIDLNSPREEEVTIKVRDLLGRVVFDQKRNVQPGLNSFELKLAEDLPDGIFTIHITDASGFSSAHKIVRVKTN